MMKEKLPDDFKRFDDFPTVHNCDPDDPYQAFLWMLVCLPMQAGGGAMAFPTNYMQLVSKRLWDLGCRPTEKPVLRYEDPRSGDANWLANPGKWVSANKPRPTMTQRPVVKAADALAINQANELVEELYKRMSPKERADMDARVKEIQDHRSKDDA